VEKWALYIMNPDPHKITDGHFYEHIFNAFTYEETATYIKWKHQQLHDQDLMAPYIGWVFNVS
jgi:hypothetical protein